LGSSANEIRVSVADVQVGPPEDMPAPTD